MLMAQIAAGCSCERLPDAEPEPFDGAGAVFLGWVERIETPPLSSVHAEVVAYVRPSVWWHGTGATGLLRVTTSLDSCGLGLGVGQEWLFYGGGSMHGDIRVGACTESRQVEAGSALPVVGRTPLVVGERPTSEVLAAAALDLDRRVVVDRPLKRGRPPEPTLLLAAIRSADLAAVERLLAAGDLPRAPGEDHYSDMTFAANSERADVLIPKLLAAGAEPFDALVATKDPMIAELLIEAGADPNGRSYWGDTPLSKAAVVADLRLLNVLLAAGADPNVTTADGRTPLMLAAATARSRDHDKEGLAVVRRLLSAGAKPDALDPRGRPAWHYAANRNHVKAAELLREALEAR